MLLTEWAIAELVLHPDVQAKLHHEVNTIVGTPSSIPASCSWVFRIHSDTFGSQVHPGSCSWIRVILTPSRIRPQLLISTPSRPLPDSPQTWLCILGPLLPGSWLHIISLARLSRPVRLPRPCHQPESDFMEVPLSWPTTPRPLLPLSLGRLLPSASDYSPQPWFPSASDCSPLALGLGLLPSTSD